MIAQANTQLSDASPFVYFAALLLFLACVFAFYLIADYIDRSAERWDARHGSRRRRQAVDRAGGFRPTPRGRGLHSHVRQSEESRHGW